MQHGLAQTSQPKDPPLRKAMDLWAAFAIVGALFIALLAIAVLARRARRRAALRQRKRERPIPSAWEEAGRRALPIRMDEPPPDVLDHDRP